MRPHGGSLAAAGEELLGVRETLELYAGDIGVPYNQVRLNLQTVSKWPAEHRVAGVSFEIHRILEKLDDRFDRIQNPPRHPRDGVPRWTQDTAKRQVGWRVDNFPSGHEAGSARMAAGRRCRSPALTLDGGVPPPGGRLGGRPGGLHRRRRVRSVAEARAATCRCRAALVSLSLLFSISRTWMMRAISWVWVHRSSRSTRTRARSCCYLAARARTDSGGAAGRGARALTRA
ncbi:DUF6192 family protein [Streptomyces massasporeus]